MSETANIREKTVGHGSRAETGWPVGHRSPGRGPIHFFGMPDHETDAEPPAEPAETSERVPEAPDPIALSRLWAEHFKYLTTLGVAGAGGVIIMLEAGIIPLEQTSWIALALFVATAVLSLLGQIGVVQPAAAALERWRADSAIIVTLVTTTSFVLLIAIVFVLINLLVDIAYSVIDPRVRVH
jgi:hypothetical protein